MKPGNPAGTTGPAYGAPTPDAHFRHDTQDLAKVLAVFDAIARDDPSYKTLADWQPFPL